MWPQPRLPPYPAMAGEIRESKLAAAKKKLKEYWHRNSPGGPAGAKKNGKTNGSVPETATSGGCHSPGDSATGILGDSPISFAPLKELEVRGSGQRCSDPAGRSSNLLPQQGLGIVYIKHVCNSSKTLGREQQGGWEILPFCTF
uniref:putative golgin subfamily A member 6-like protein 3 n=1 Tax=Macaca mulatta TaxID=9544 RepID=UPI0010A2547C|nr:putative golgin subfamily A member 6-like protein 3 [Macaca mulatta]